MHQPLIGITVDNKDNSAASRKYEVAIAYSRAVTDAGGVPVLLPHEPQLAPLLIARLHGLVLTGGTDPKTESFGEPTHPKAKAMDERRQSFELALLDAAAARPDMPVLGICLGEQLMALHAGGRLNQHLPDTLAHPEVHQKDAQHPVDVHVDDSLITAADAEEHRSPERGVRSWHTQAVSDPGRLRLVATAPDGVIEAIDDPSRAFYLGVQWHPERGGAGPLNQGLFDALVRACRPRPRGSPPAMTTSLPGNSLPGDSLPGDSLPGDSLPGVIATSG
jgi:putative glutamine amidotransferase